MRTGGKTALTVREACLAAGLTFCLAAAQAEDRLYIAISDATVTIQADHSSVRSVLEELSRQTNLIVISQEPLDDPVTVEIHEPTVSQAIRHLLRQKSFMLHQLSRVSESLYPAAAPYSRLWIFSENPDGRQHAWTTQSGFWPAFDGGKEMTAYQILASSADGSDREEAMYGFGDVGNINGIENLEQGLTDPDARVREAAIESLADIGGAESVQALSVIMNDPDARLRVDAVDALGQIGGQYAIRLLQDAMFDEDYTVREAAAECLTDLAWQRH